MKKLKTLLALVIATSLTLVGCGQKAAEEPKKEEENPFEKVAALYEEQINGHEEIDFAIDSYGSENATYMYEYAFVNMNDDDIPELLIGKTDESFGVKYIKVFYYDKESNKLLSPTETIQIGVAGAGGFRADVIASNKKDGLLLNQGSGMNGQFEIARINLDIKEDGTVELKNTTLQEYMLGDAVERETEGEGKIITWYAIDDLSALEQFKAGKLDLNKEPEESAESQPKEETEQPKETGAVVDNKTVFQGTLKYLSYNEVLELQGIDDPNAGYADTSEKFAILVLGGETDVTAESGDGTGSHTDKAKMIKLANFADAANYNGKEVKVKITSMFWPSDTSLPLLEPYALEGEYEIVE